MSEEKPQGAENKPTETHDSEKADSGQTQAQAAGSRPAAPPKAEAGPAVSKAPSKPKEAIKTTRPSPKKAVATDARGSLWMSRRNFFSRAGWVAFFSFLASFLIGSLRFMFPRVLFEPSPVFIAGFPDDYPLGSVSTAWIKAQRVWIVHGEEGIYAIFAKCTHLGCTPRWLDAENKFKCPCHGSGFTRAGINFEGPAPRPLERIKVSLTEDGRLRVDKSIKFREENGDWGKPGSFLPV